MWVTAERLSKRLWARRIALSKGAVVRRWAGAKRPSTGCPRSPAGAALVTGRCRAVALRAFILAVGDHRTILAVANRVLTKSDEDRQADRFVIHSAWLTKWRS